VFAERVREAFSPGVLARAVLQRGMPSAGQALVTMAGTEEIPGRRKREAAASTAEPTAAEADPEKSGIEGGAWVIPEKEF